MGSLVETAGNNQNHVIIFNYDIKTIEKLINELNINCHFKHYQLTFWFDSFCALLLSLWRTLSHKRISPGHPCFLKQQPEPFRFWIGASSVLYSENWQNLWIAMTLVCSQEKRNFKFSFANFKRIFDGFKNWRQNDISVGHGVVKPAGIAQICRSRMLESVLILLTMLLQFGPRFFNNFVIDDYFSILIALRMPISTASQAYLRLSW